MLARSRRSRVGHAVDAGPQPFLGLVDGGVVRLPTGLELFPGRRDDAGIHEGVHDERQDFHLATREVTHQQRQSSASVDEARGPRQDRADIARVAEKSSRSLQDDQCWSIRVTLEWAVVGEVTVAQCEIAGRFGVEERDPSFADSQSEGRPVALRVSERQRVPVDRVADAVLDAAPDLVDAHPGDVVVPSARVSDPGGRLERRHRVPHGRNGLHHFGHLVEILGRDGHRVGQVGPEAPQPTQLLEHGGEGATVLVEVGLTTRSRYAATSAHEGVKVGRERDTGQPKLPVGPGHDGLEVVGTEIPVRHGHGLAARGSHREQCLRVCLGLQQRHLAADELSMRTRSPQSPQQRHLLGDLPQRVAAVDAHLVRVGGVVAGRAGQVDRGKTP